VKLAKLANKKAKQGGTGQGQGAGVEAGTEAEEGSGSDVLNGGRQLKKRKIKKTKVLFFFHLSSFCSSLPSPLPSALRAMLFQMQFSVVVLQT
jgi:hypothetical protein